MNNHNRIKAEQINKIYNDNYHFEPIDHDSSSSSTMDRPQTTTQFIERPVPICHSQSNGKLENTTNICAYNSLTKRNSTIPTDENNRSFQLPRSITSDQLSTTKHQSHHSKINRLYCYPSVQDVLDALQQRSFEKESFV